MKKMFFAALMLTLALPLTAFAAPRLAWDPSTGQVDGYKIYYGTSSGHYTGSRDVGLVTEYPLTNLNLTEKQTYFFVAKAYNTAGESAGSNEVSYTVPDNTPPSIPTGVSVQ